MAPVSRLFFAAAVTLLLVGASCAPSEGEQQSAAECTSNADCDEGRVCKVGECVDVSHSSGNGGAGTTSGDSGGASTSSGDSGGASTAAGGASGPRGCSECPKGCFDLTSDVGNCGSCGFECGDDVAGAETTCKESACVTSCIDATHTICDGACVSINDDTQHCGSCNFGCSEQGVCVAGACDYPKAICTQSNADPPYFLVSYNQQGNQESVLAVEQCSCSGSMQLLAKYGTLPLPHDCASCVSGGSMGVVAVCW